MPLITNYLWMAVTSAGEVAMALDTAGAGDPPVFIRVTSPPGANSLRKLLHVPGYWLTTSATDSKVFVISDGSILADPDYDAANWTGYPLIPTCDSFNDLPLAYGADVGLYVGRNTAQAYHAQLSAISAWGSVTVVSGSTSCQGAAANDTTVVIGDNNGKVNVAGIAGVFSSITTAHNSGADIFQVKWAPVNAVFLTVAHVNAGADLCSSPTGLAASWTPRHNYAGASKLGRSVCETPTGGLIFVGDIGIIQWTASLGGVWANAAVNPLSTEAIIDVACHLITGRCIAVATSGKMAYSDDGGNHWALLDSPFNPANTVQAIVCAEIITRAPGVLIPRAVGHYPYIDPRSFIDSDKPK